MKDIPLEIVTIEKASDIQPPLEGDVAGFLNGMMDGARQNFDQSHEINPVFMMLKGKTIIPCIIGELNPEIKPALFNWMHQQVPKHDACIFVVETWFAKAMKSEKENLLLSPSERMDKREMVMVHLWMKDRSIAVVAEIERNPDRLGPWEKLSDSADPKSTDCQGQMVRQPEKGKP